MTTRVKAFFVRLLSSRPELSQWAQMKALIDQPVIINGEKRQPVLRKVA